jgi:hypothetical protein
MLYGFSGVTGMRPWEVKINKQNFYILQRYLFVDRWLSWLKKREGETRDDGGASY